jgi:hypothetical protein
MGDVSKGVADTLLPTKKIYKKKRTFGPQQRTFSTLKHEISQLFPVFVGHFCPPGSGPADQNQCGSMKFRIRNTGTFCEKFKLREEIRECYFFRFVSISNGSGNVSSFRMRIHITGLQTPKDFPNVIEIRVHAI